jgi:eukaryotic-like serine/threonine-protein kinase
MDGERWQRVNELFAATLERAPGERAAFLREACDGDDALRAEVESLLDADSRAGEFIERPAFSFDAALTEDTTQPTPRRRFGPYEVVAMIGRGGMGEVYRARDPRLGREVAIKTLPHESHGDPVSLRRLELEARAAGALNHPNILAIYDVGSEAGVPYVVSELLEGETLQARLRRGALPPEEALRLAGQTAAGLAAAHEKGVVHRDLKPANLFVTRDGRLKILDFGLAKRHAPLADSAGYTQPGVVMGTVGYMAPEQVRGQPVDPRADIFAFGAVLYEMLAGKRAFTGASPVETMGEILHREPPPLAGRGITVALENVLRRCLRKSPEERFAAGAALAEALTALADDRKSVPPSTAPSTLPGAQDTLAVLPFVNLGGDPDQEYFCDGLAEELIGALGRLPGLRVLARPPAGARLPGGDDLRALGRELGVTKALEGSVRRAGGRLRISVQMIDVASGAHLWSTKYDREMRDVFALQDEIAREVATALRLRLAAPVAGRRHSADLEAYQLYLRGRHQWHKRHEGGLQESVRCYEQALDRDPGYALAWAGLAESYVVMGIGTYDILPPREGMPRARAAAQRALELDPDLADAHACLGFVALHYDWDLERSGEHFGRALELQPERAITHHWNLFLLAARGEFDAAQAESRRAWELDPLSLIVNAGLAAPRYHARDLDGAAEAARKLTRLAPEFPVGHFWLGHALAAQGNPRAALAEFETYSRLAGGGSRGLALIGWAQAASGDASAAQETLRALAERARDRYVPALHRALVRIGLGEHEAALDELELAVEERCDHVPFFPYDPLLDPVRAHPRFARLLAAAGLRPQREISDAGADSEAGGPRTVAVLPFLDLAGGPDNAHLGLGLADATIGELARVRGLVVRPTSAILRYAAGPIEARRLQAELAVGHLVVGTFQRAGDRLRVSVQLLGAGESALWATRIETSLDDLFGVQDEVSRQIARALAPRLGSASGPASPKARPSAHVPAGAAYELYLKGRTRLFRETLEDCLAAVDYLDRACARDPEFALGWAGLADAYSRIAFTFIPEGDWYGRAWKACERALALDPLLPEARYVRGGRLLWSPQHGFDHAAALADLVPALAARPSLEEGRVRLGVVLHHVGLIDDVEEQIAQALEISPGHPLAREHQGLVEYTRGHFAEALAIYRRAQDDVPHSWLHYRVALCELQLGRAAEVERMVERMLQQQPDDVLVHPLLALLAARRGDGAEARRQVAQMEAHRRDFGHFHHAEYDAGCVFAQLGDADSAVAWLRRAADNGFPCAPEFEADPLLAPVRGHAGFQALLADLGERRRGYAALYARLKRESQTSPT